MAKSDMLTIPGTVIKALPNACFEVRLNTGNSVFCYTSGKIRKNGIRIVPGDSVTVELTRYDLSKGRIVYRN